MRPIDEEVLCRINRQMISQFGGWYVKGVRNIQNADSLSYLVADQQFQLLSGSGEIREIAATVAYRVITRHVFFDGNKRTGMQAAFLLLQLNSHAISPSPDDIVDTAGGVATGAIALQELTRWFRAISEPV